MGHIIMQFKPGGDVKILPQGFAGNACHTATEPYESAMKGRRQIVEGEQTLADEKTREEQRDRESH